MKRFFSKLLFSSLVFCAAFGQTPLPLQNIVRISPPEAVKAKPGATVSVALSVHVDAGFHVNSNQPSDPYFIPLRLTWTPGTLKNAAVTFPKPKLEKLGFSAMPVSVFTGDFDITTRFKTGAGAGSSTLTGKLHYQACNETTCLTPKTIDVTLPVEIVK
jgi:DsbC/DsbD-like thiol-disulfide interchange protein